MNELRAGAPITVAGMNLVPIERVQINAIKQSNGYWLNAMKEVVAVVICEPQGPRIMNVGMQDFSLDEILTLLPEVKSSCLKQRELTI
jgi:hypothetical protein